MSLVLRSTDSPNAIPAVIVPNSLSNALKLLKESRSIGQVYSDSRTHKSYFTTGSCVFGASSLDSDSSETYKGGARLFYLLTDGFDMRYDENVLTLLRELKPGISVVDV